MASTTIDIMTRHSILHLAASCSCHLQEILRSSSAIHCHNSCLTMQDGLTNTKFNGCDSSISRRLVTFSDWIPDRTRRSSCICPPTPSSRPRWTNSVRM